MHPDLGRRAVQRPYGHNTGRRSGVDGWDPVRFHDGLFAREAMFVAKALEYTLRRVVLLTVNRSVLLQNTVDDIRELCQEPADDHAPGRFHLGHEEGGRQEPPLCHRRDPCGQRHREIPTSPPDDKRGSGYKAQVFARGTNRRIPLGSCAPRTSRDMAILGRQHPGRVRRCGRAQVGRHAVNVSAGAGLRCVSTLPVDRIAKGLSGLEGRHPSGGEGNGLPGSPRIVGWLRQ